MNGRCLFVAFALVVSATKPVSADDSDVTVIKGTVKLGGKPQAGVSVSCVKGLQHFGSQHNPDGSIETGKDGSFTLVNVQKHISYCSVEAYAIVNEHFYWNRGEAILNTDPSHAIPPTINLMQQPKITRFSPSMGRPVILLASLPHDGRQTSDSQVTTSVKLTLKGTITSITGHPVDGAVIVIRDLQNAKETSKVPLPESHENTNEDGDYTHVFTHQGQYLVSVFADEYESEMLVFEIDRKGGVAIWRPGPDGTLSKSSQRDVSLTLIPRGMLLEPKRVSGPAPSAAVKQASDLHERAILVDTLTASRSALYTSLFAQSLPLPDWRSPDSLAFLSPGVAPPAQPIGPLFPAVAPGFGAAGQFSINGLRARDNNFSIDGSDDNDEELGVRREGIAAPFPEPIESLLEFRLITALPDATFGRGIAGQINALSSIGKTSFHGQIWGFVAGGPFRAGDPFAVKSGAYPAYLRQSLPITENGLLGAPTVGFDTYGDQSPPFQAPNGVRMQPNPAANTDHFTRAQSGFVLSGPLGRGPANFIVSYERRTLRESQQENFAVPTADQRQMCPQGSSPGRESGAYFTLSCIPLSTSGAVYPVSLRGDALWSLFPFANNSLGPYGGSTFTETLPADANAHVYMIQINDSWKIGGLTNALTMRYNGSNESSDVPVTSDALFSSVKAPIHTHNGALFFDTGFSASLANSFRFSYGKTSATFSEIRDSFLSPSTRGLGPFMLNAPLLINVTTEPGPPQYATAKSFAGSDALTVESGQNLPRMPGPTVSQFFTGVSTSCNLSTDYSCRIPTFADQIDTAGLGELSLGGFSTLGANVDYFPQSRANSTLQWADTLTKVYRSHTILAGADVRRVQLNDNVDRNLRPAADYRGLFNIEVIDCRGFGNDCGTPASGGKPPTISLMSAQSMVSAGLAAAAIQTFALVAGNSAPNYSLKLRTAQADFFLQDEWSIHPNLRLIAGLRLQDEPVPQDVSGHFAQAFNGPQIYQQAQSCNVPGCQSLLPVLQALLPSSLQSALDPRHVAIDGRIGLAWDPFGNGKTSIRAGFGRYTGQFPALLVDEARNAFPTFLTVSGAVNTGLTQTLASNSGVTLGNGIIQLNGQNPIQALLALSQTLHNNALAANLVYPSPGMKTPYSLQQHFTIERQMRGGMVFSLAYVGTVGRRLLIESTPLGGPDRSYAEYAIAPIIGLFPFPYGCTFFSHPPLGGTNACVSTASLPGSNGSPTPGWTINSLQFGGGASSKYNSLQATLHHSLGHGVQFNTAATWSRTMDNVSDIGPLAGAFALPQNSTQPSEWGPSNFDVRFRSATEFIVDSGSFTNRKPLRGWILAGILTLQTGQPYTVNTSSDVNMDGNATDRLNNLLYLVPGVGSRTKLRLNLPPDGSTIAMLADPGKDGSVGRNTFRGWGLYNLDLSLGRTFTWSDAYKLALRGEVFNCVNHPNFGIPERILESPAFGSAVNSVTSPRTFQLMMKLIF